MSENIQPPNIEGFNLEAALTRLRGNWPRFYSLLMSFIDSNLDADTRMSQLINEQQWPEAQRLAHQLKGSAANLGADDLSLAAAHLEEALKLEQFQHAADLLTAFNQQITQLTNAKQQLLVFEASNHAVHNSKKNQLIELLIQLESQLHIDLSRSLQLLDKITALCENSEHQEFSANINAAFDSLNTAHLIDLCQHKRRQLES